MGLGVPQDPNIATFAREGDHTLTAARSLASQIENMNLPEVVAASPLKAVKPDGSQGWMVRVVYTSDAVPVPITELANTRRVDWEEKTTSNNDAGRAFVRLGIVSALMWTGIAIAGGTAIWWAVSAATDDSSTTSE